MTQELSERTKFSLVLANQEAQRFNHSYLGTEHILLGLQRLGVGTAFRLLSEVGADLRSLRAVIERMRPSGHDIVEGQQPLTYRASRALEIARDEANRFGSETVEPEHVLLGLLIDQNCTAATILKALAVNLPAFQEATTRHLGARH